MADIIQKSITIGRKTILFGMHWYTVSEDESIAKAAANFVKGIDDPFDLVVIRKAAAPQYGLASVADGAKSGQFSAAAIIAAMVGSDMTQDDSWLYVLEIQNSIWVCAGRDGYILPNGDRIFDDVDLAKDFVDSLTPSSFKKLYLPTSWKRDKNSRDQNGLVMEDIDETDLTDFISIVVPKWAKLRSLSPISPTMKITALGGILALAGAVGLYMVAQPSTQYKGPTPAQLIKAQQAMKQAAELQRKQKFAQLDANKPWTVAPKADAVLTACLKGIRSMPSSVVGYEITSVSCDGHGVHAAIKRTTGYSRWLTEWVKAYPSLSVTPSNNGQSGDISKSLPNLPARGAETMTKFSTLSNEFSDIGQVIGADLHVTGPAVTKIPSQPDYVPLFASSSFRITTDKPSLWLPFFRKNGGMVINQITFDLSKQTYTMEGELYVPNLS